jgi:hypothetical protein
MKRAIQTGVLLLLAMAAGICDQKGNPKPTPRAVNPNRAVNPSKGGVPKGGGGRINNPANPVQRLLLATPEERERVLEKLPPQQQARIRQGLERFDRLPEGEKSRLLQQLQAFRSLPPDKQMVVSRQIQTFNSLPQERLQPMRRELKNLLKLPESEREARLNSEEFKQNYSPAEQQVLSDLSRSLPQNYPLAGK